MARGTLLRRGLVKEHILPFYDPHELMTRLAADVLMCSLQREDCALLVIEQGRLPFCTGVTFNAGRDAVLRELLAMHVFMALFTLGHSRLEVYVHHLSFKIRRLVAVDACSRPVCSQKGKRRGRVIKSRELAPRLCIVAGFAAKDFAAGCWFLHPILELAPVRIGVAGCA